VKPRPPALYRLSRLFRILSVVALLLIIVALGVVVYSAVQFRPNDVSTPSVTGVTYATQVANLFGAVNFTNPGYVDVNSLHLNGSVYNSNNSWLGSGVSNPGTLRAGSTTPLSFTLKAPISAILPAATLLTQDQTLRIALNASVTYAVVFTLGLHVNFNVHWGAPFSNLMIKVTNVTTSPTGTANVTIQVTFANHSPSSLDGGLNLGMENGAGVVCATGMFGLSVPPGGAYNNSVTISAGAGCGGHGQYVDATLSTPQGSAVTFLREKLP